MRFEEIKMNEAREVNGGISVIPVSPVIPIIVTQVVAKWIASRSN